MPDVTNPPVDPRTWPEMQQALATMTLDTARACVDRLERAYKAALQTGDQQSQQVLSGAQSALRARVSELERQSAPQTKPATKQA